jgi:hypothetical protein
MANSMQGFAVLVFLVAFTCLSVALFQDGSILMLLLFLASLGASLVLFLKAKAITAAGK